MAGWDPGVKRYRDAKGKFAKAGAAMVSRAAELAQRVIDRPQPSRTPTGRVGRTEKAFGKLKKALATPAPRPVGARKAVSAKELGEVQVSPSLRTAQQQNTASRAPSQKPSPTRRKAEQMTAPPPAQPAKNAQDAAKADIRSAVARLASPGGYVMLTDVRRELGDRHSRADVDEAIRELNREDPNVVVLPESNQKTLTDADRAAAVVIGNQQRHLIRIGGAAPAATKEPLAVSMPLGTTSNLSPTLRRKAERMIAEQSAARGTDADRAAPVPVRLDLNEWTDRSGRTRRYVNNWQDVIGLKLTRYNSGNISSATIDGEPISNAAAGRIASAKVWLDANDEVHVDYWSDAPRKLGERGETRALTAEKVRARIAEVYAAQKSADLARAQAAASPKGTPFAKAASTATAAVDNAAAQLERLRAALRSGEPGITRERAREAVTGLTVPQLKVVYARLTGGSTPTASRKADLVMHIVELAVGRQLDSYAIWRGTGNTNNPSYMR